MRVCEHVDVIRETHECAEAAINLGDVEDLDFTCRKSAESVHMLEDWHVDATGLHPEGTEPTKIHFGRAGGKDWRRSSASGH